ncbi:MAG TPA: hypothetical protein VGD78_22010 [Chthoniobacterales bacterium]
MFQPPSYHEAYEQSHKLFGSTPLGPVAHALLEHVCTLFYGGHARYQACDTAFHDFEHTMQATAAVLRLLQAHQQHPRIAALQERDRLLAFASVLFHDTGYLKTRDDHEGSGAKYTSIHVGRSCFVAHDHLPEFGFSPGELRLVQNAISATAVAVRMEALPFRDGREWLVAAMVGTGDMLGQLAAHDYPERLAGLYLEFREASAFSRLHGAGFATHGTLLELLEGTEAFYTSYVLRMLDVEWKGLHRLLVTGKGPNLYVQQMLANVVRVKTMARLLSGDERRRTEWQGVTG